VILRGLKRGAIANRLKEKALTRVFGFATIPIGLRMIVSYFLPQAMDESS
jgi:hypothetical protein